MEANKTANVQTIKVSFRRKEHSVKNINHLKIEKFDSVYKRTVQRTLAFSDSANLKRIIITDNPRTFLLVTVHPITIC